MTPVPSSVLIVDADVLFGAALAAEAQAAGLRAICCRSWWEAKPVLEGLEPVDVMIVDLVLPPGTPNGVSAALMARARREGLPVVFTSEDPALLDEVRPGTGVTLAKTVGVQELVRRAVDLAAGEAGGPSRSIPHLAPSPRAVLSPVARYRLDRRTCFRSVSDSALALWRRSRAELLGRPLLEVFPQLADKSKFQAHLEVLSGRGAYRGVLTSVILQEPIDIRIAPDRLGLRVEFARAA